MNSSDEDQPKADHSNTVINPFSPSWHGEILENRRQKVSRGEGKFISISQLKRRLGFRAE